MENTEKLVAVFIDADNTQYDKLNSIFEKITAYGRIVIKRAYGNWTKPTLASWNDCSKNYAIKQVQQIDYVSGKNTTDIALIIDAMDFVSRSNCDIFAIVSSDSDFTPLAIKLRELGKYIIGIGRKQTSLEAFVNSCDEFIYVEDLEGKKNTKIKKKITKKEENLIRWIERAADSYQDDEGFTNISDAGSYIKRISPEFNINNFGFKKLSEYFEGKPELFEIQRIQIKGNISVIKYRIK